MAAPKGVEVVTTLGPFDPEDIDGGNAVWILLERRGHRVNKHGTMVDSLQSQPCWPVLKSYRLLTPAQAAERQLLNILKFCQLVGIALAACKSALVRVSISRKWQMPQIKTFPSHEGQVVKDLSICYYTTCIFYTWYYSRPWE